ncbi:MAG: TM2 domain-containing protein, partial [Clostridia bacterium]|nr:TM2 domain-containing protein [Clostridia bacterium]
GTSLETNVRTEEGNTVTYTNYQGINANDDTRKSKLAAGLLGIFLGSLGIHNFYLGYQDKAITQLLLTLIGWIVCGLGPIVASIWGLVEGIIILAQDDYKDAKGNLLKQ